MNATRHLSKTIYLVIAIALLLFIVVSAGYAVVTSNKAQPEKAVHDAWVLMSQVGKYQFSTTVEQVTYPAPALTNVGRSSTTEVINLSGETDLENRTMNISLRQDTGSLVKPQEGVEIKVAAGKASGRVIGSETWQNLDQFSTASFAPGQDASSFLVAARNVQLQSTNSLTLPDRKGVNSTVQVAHYSFQIDPDRFADYMRDQLTKQLQNEGKLHPGLDLNLTNQYRGMDASGEVWIDSDGLPVRMKINMKMPTASTGERVEAHVSTDFLSPDRKNLYAARPLPWKIAGMIGLRLNQSDMAQTAAGVAMSASLLALLLIAVKYSQKKLVYAIVAGLVILSMLVSPIWQSAKANAFSTEVHQQQAQAEAQLKQREQAEQQEANLFNWNPQVSPFDQLKVPSVVDAAASSAASPQAYGPELDLSKAPQAVTGDSTEADADQDGLTDAYETSFPVTVLNPNKADTDNDGLTDNQELKLNLLPGKNDTDHDGILDNDEVNSFYYAGKDWYTNPSKYDTDIDGQLDAIECPERMITADNPTPGICRDTDLDGTPDVFDEDDDGDGVPTFLDESPLAYSANPALYTAASPLKLSFNNLESDRPVFVTLQLRPENPQHLTYTMNVLDWPSNDTAGQIQRVSNDTFATSLNEAQKASDPKTANGDLRLMPMVEIRLKGSAVPLPVTQTMSFTLEDPDFTGTFQLTSQPGTGQTQVKLTEGPDQPNPIYYGTGNCDKYTEVAKVGDLALGATGLASSSLGDLVNGNNVIFVSNAAHNKSLACVEIPIAAHGTMKDDLVDSTLLTAYGASARNDTDGSVLVYAPLTLVQDSLTGMPAAFTAKVPFLNRGNAFASAQQEVKVVWLLNMLTDSCKPKPADYEESETKIWCDPKDLTHWNTNIPQVVFSYSDNFHLAGLSVSEDHGVDMDVVFENPATDPEPKFDDPLWALATGLEHSLMAGRSVSTGVDGQGKPIYQRDITIAEIQHRFDPDQNGDIPDDDARLWGQSRDAFQVEHYSYPIADGVSAFMTGGVKDLFAEYYNSLPAERIPESALLLFAREATTRHMALTDLTSACSGDICTLDFAGQPVLKTAVLNWAPYHRDGANWTSFPIAGYLDKLEASLRTLDGFQPLDGSQDERDAADGRVLLARYYFQGMYTGAASLVEFNGTPAFNPEDAVNDGSLAGDFSTHSARGQFLSGKPTELASSMVDALGDNPNLAQVGKNLGTIKEKIKDYCKDLKQTLSSKSNLVAKLKGIKLWSAVDFVISTTLTTLILASMAVTYFSMDGKTSKWAGRALDILMGAKAVYDGIKGTVEAIKDFKAAASVFSSVSKAAKVAAIVGLILNLVITWGVFILTAALSGAAIFGLAFNDMLAQAIAASIVLILMAVLAFTVVGAVVMAIIGLIDGLIGLACAAVSATELVPDGVMDVLNNYVCIGISGWLTKIIKWTIYSQTYMVNYSSGDRLAFTGMSQDVKDKLAGVTPGNMMSYSMKVENTIALSGIPFDWKAASYWWQYNADTAKSATFVYKLQTESKDIHDGLNLGDIAKDWEPIQGKDNQWLLKRAAEGGTKEDRYVFAVPDAGFNQEPQVVFSEGSAIPVQECWAIPVPIFPIGTILVPVCYIRTEQATINSPMGSSLTLDVLPKTLDEFYTLEEREQGGYALAWNTNKTLQFPTLRDADGDLLISKALGGNDPDDAKYDTDGDTLSDYYEISHGLDPRKFDTDGDGLNDADEISQGTSPLHADTDGDGLTDQQELAGWLFTYGFTPGGTPQETMVYPDPFMQDSDGDGITDLLEKVYGFNPRVKNQANVLDYALSMREMDSPLVLLRFDETSGAAMFADSSNFMFNAICEGETCPVSGIDGRYAQAVRLDGANYLHLPTSARSISFVNAPFTLGAWVYTQGSGVVLAKWGDAPDAKRELRLEVNSTGSLTLVGATASVTSAGTLPQNAWAHAAVSYDGTQVTFYINGEASGCQGSCTWSNSPTYAANINDVELTAGAYESSTGYTGFFTGGLDELAVFDRALTGPEIQDRLVAARYNFNDSFVRPGEAITYRSQVTNLLNNRFVYGLVTTLIDRTDAIVDWAKKLLPQTFTLGPDNPVATQEKTTSISNTLQIDPNVSESGNLKISQTVSAQVVDRRTESNMAELWLTFNEAAGAAKFEDSSGNMPPRSLTCSACPESGVSGILNQAVRFAAGGSSTPLALPDLDTLRLVNRGYTLAMWVKPEAVGSNTTINLFQAADDQLRLSLLRLPNGEYRPQVYANGAQVLITNWRDLLPGVWSHLVARYDSQSLKLTLYVNGASVGEADGVAPISGNAAFTLGGVNPIASYAVDDVRVFSRPLSTVDINRLAERPVLKLNMDGSINDSSVYSQPVAAVHNNPALVSNSIRGSAMTPGTGSGQGSIQVNGNSLLSMSDGTFSFSVWINPTSYVDNTTWQGVFGYHSGDNDAYPTLERRGRQLRFAFGDGTQFQTQTSGDVLEEGRWNHVAVTFQPSSLAGPYEYVLYVNGVERDSHIFTSKPAAATNSTFYVGQSSRKYWSSLDSLKVDDTGGDWGGSAEMQIIRTVNNAEKTDVWGSLSSQQNVDAGQTYSIGVTSRVFTGDETVAYDAWEIDNSNWTNPDDYCGKLEQYWWETPGQKSAPMTNGINGTLTAALYRPSIQFMGIIDELEVYRYALDSEQVYDLYNSIPITARLPLDDRPASNSFENRAVIGVQDDGVCSGAACPSAGTIGLMNQAVRFDGADDVISVPVDTTENYMVSLWVNTTCTNCGLYSLKSSSSTLNQIYLKNGNLCALTGSSELCSRGSGVADSRWHHAVYTNDGSTANLWLDGAVASTINGGPKVTAAANGQALLGYAPNASKPTLDGQLDDVRVFRYSQAAEVVAQLQRRAPLLLAHLDEASAANGFKDATPQDWVLDCAGGQDQCPKTDMDGRLGRSVEFDGQNDLLSLHQDQLSARTQSFSVGIWVMPTRLASQAQTLWAIPNAGDTQRKYSVAIAPNTMQLCVMNSASADCLPQSNVDLIMNTWNYVTLTVDRTDSAYENYTLYVNGYRDQTGAGNQGGQVVDGLGRLALGGDPAGITGPFAGKLDEPTVYEYVLNEIDVRDTYYYQMQQVEERASLSMTIDADDPQVNLASYNTDFPYLAGHDTMLQVDASDMTSGIGMVEMIVEHPNAVHPNWVVAPVCRDSSNGTSFCPTFNPTSGDGAYTLTFRAVDKVGRQMATQPYPINVDNGAPRIIIDQLDQSLMAAELHPTLEHTWYLHLTGRVGDDTLSNGTAGAGLDQSTVRVTVYSETGETTGAGTQVPTLTPAANGYTWTLDYLFSEKEPTGKLTVTVEASDKVGNAGKQSVQVYLDATPSTAKLNTANLSQPSADALLTLAEDKNPIMTSGEFSGTASDIPGDQSPYITTDGKKAASGVQKIQVALTPSNDVSFLYNEPYPQGLLAWLPLDGEIVPNGTAGTPDPNLPGRYFLDVSPYQVSGTCMKPECPLPGISGHVMGSVYFNGQQQSINLGNQVNLAGRSFTVSLWARREAAGRSDPMIWQGPVSMTNQRFLFGLNSNNQFVCGFGGSDLLTGETYSDTDWHYWACAFDQPSGQRTIYRDGRKVAEDSTTPLPAMNENFYIGLAPVGSYQGYLDNLVVLDHALNANQIREQYTGYQAVFHLTVDSNFYHSGDRLFDRSGFFHSATLLSNGDENNKVVAGRVGDYALRFDGSDKLTVVPAYSLQLDRAAFTQTAWVYPSSGAGEQDIISQRDENPENRYPTLSMTGDGRVIAGFGTGYNWLSLQTDAGIIMPDAWNFVAATFDGKTYSIYVNGQLKYQTGALAGQMPYPANTFNIGDQLNGMIDDVKVFTRPLSSLEIQAMAETGWRDATITSTNGQPGWKLDLVKGVEGPYQVDVRAWDQQNHFGTDSSVLNQWGGSIDTLAPRMTIKREPVSKTELDKFNVEFVVEDIMLDENSLRQNLCPDVTVTREYFNSAWLLATGAPPNSQLYRVTGKCQASPQAGVEQGISACDLGGNCVSKTYPVEVAPLYPVYLPIVFGSGSASFTSTQTNAYELNGLQPGANLQLPLLADTLAKPDGDQAPGVDILTEKLGPEDMRSLLHVNLQGHVTNPETIAWVQVKIRKDGREIFTNRAAISGEIWNAMWIFTPGKPIADGVYQVEVTAADLAGHQTSVSRDITVQLTLAGQGEVTK